jgi:hypothetical protein
MTQEQLNQIEAWRDILDVKQNDENIVNAMWLAEEMWERHHSIMKFKNVQLDFSTYMMAFCMALMEYIWIPHDIIKAITAGLDDLDTMPEEFICIDRVYIKNYHLISMSYMVRMSYMGTTDEDYDYEKRWTLKVCDTETEAEALTAILNHANKAGHDAIKRLSA